MLLYLRRQSSIFPQLLATVTPRRRSPRRLLGPVLSQLFYHTEAATTFTGAVFYYPVYIFKLF